MNNLSLHSKGRKDHVQILKEQELKAKEELKRTHKNQGKKKSAIKQWIIELKHKIKWAKENLYLNKRGR